jgi:hypothetical protein
VGTPPFNQAKNQKIFFSERSWLRAHYARSACPADAPAGAGLADGFGVAVGLCRGQLGADLIGFGGAEAGVEGEGLLPVTAGLADLAGSLVGSGEAVMGAALLVFPADLGGQAERGSVLDAGLPRLTGAEEHVAEAIERVGFIVPIAGLAR